MNDLIAYEYLATKKVKEKMEGIIYFYKNYELEKNNNMNKKVIELKQIVKNDIEDLINTHSKLIDY